MKSAKEYCQEHWRYEGASAQYVYTLLRDPANKAEANYPHDPDDLCRCIQVLRGRFSDCESSQAKGLAIVALKTRTREPLTAKSVAEKYQALAENWKELMTIFKSEWEQNRLPKTYAFMQKIYSETGDKNRKKINKTY